MKQSMKSRRYQRSYEILVVGIARNIAALDVDMNGMRRAVWKVGVVVQSRSRFGTRLEHPGAKPNMERSLHRVSSRFHPALEKTTYVVNICSQWRMFYDL